MGVPVATTSSTELVPVALAQGHESQQVQQQQVPEEEEGPEINIDINNVVCSFATRCHLNLKKIAMEGVNVIYKRENGVSGTCDARLLAYTCIVLCIIILRSS